MDNENIKNEIEIDLRGLFSAIMNRLTIIILVGILVGGMAFVYTQYFVDQLYVAKTKVYILNKQDENQRYLTSQDVALSTYLAKDYESLLTTDPVLEEVKKESKKTLVANTSFNDKYTGEKYAEKTEFIVVKEDIETTKVKDNQYKISAKRAGELKEKGYMRANYDQAM